MQSHWVSTRADWLGAWVYLLMQAEWKDGEDHATLTATERELAASWKWSRGSVRHYLEKLGQDRMISKVGSTISILNFDRWQQKASESLAQDLAQPLAQDLAQDLAQATGSKERDLPEVSAQDLAQPLAQDLAQDLAPPLIRKKKSKKGKEEEREKPLSQTLSPLAPDELANAVIREAESSLGLGVSLFQAEEWASAFVELGPFEEAETGVKEFFACIKARAPNGPVGYITKVLKCGAKQYLQQQREAKNAKTQRRHAGSERLARRGRYIPKQ